MSHQSLLHDPPLKDLLPDQRKSVKAMLTDIITKIFWKSDVFLILTHKNVQNLPNIPVNWVVINSVVQCDYIICIIIFTLSDSGVLLSTNHNTPGHSFIYLLVSGDNTISNSNTVTDDSILSHVLFDVDIVNNQCLAML